MKQTLFLAGAGGVIGLPLCKLLLDAGHTVYGTTRSADKAGRLAALGVKPVIVDVFDAGRLEAAVAAAKPDTVLHQLTDLPDGLNPAEMEAALVRNARIRDEGTRNLVRAARAAGVKKIIAQSIAFVYAAGNEPHDETAPLLDFTDPAYGETARAVHSLETRVLAGGNPGIILRYGMLYGGASGIAAVPPGLPPLHTDAAAYAALLALDGTASGIYNVAEACPQVKSDKFRRDFPAWRDDFRL